MRQEDEAKRKKIRKFFAQTFILFLHKHSKAALNSQTMSMLISQSMNPKSSVWVWRASRAAFFWLAACRMVHGMVDCEADGGVGVANEPSPGIIFFWGCQLNEGTVTNVIADAQRERASYHVPNLISIYTIECCSCVPEAPSWINRRCVWERARAVAYFPCGGLCLALALDTHWNVKYKKICTLYNPAASSPHITKTHSIWRSRTSRHYIRLIHV